MTLHLRIARPDCWTETATERTPWAWDRGAACGGAQTPADASRLLKLTPGCHECARLRRGLALSAKTAEPHIPDYRGAHARATASVAGASIADSAVCIAANATPQHSVL